MRKTEKIDGVEYEVIYRSAGSVPSSAPGISCAGVVQAMVLAVIAMCVLVGLLDIVLTTVR